MTLSLFLHLVDGLCPSMLVAMDRRWMSSVQPSPWLERPESAGLQKNRKTRVQVLPLPLSRGHDLSSLCL
jgi:hypothetical protein